ncbi:MAG: hypothetical protein KME20_24190 [Kaiparowitsia implicata GSE-PSE-MK54-09C]|jgi:uncharacterized membrane protein YccC|nr:hypothetical protein [Kaiparowitsia implicata GSE-PSE-MK54-09C]
MNPILFVAALIITFLVFGWLVRVARATLSLAITVAILVFLLQILLGIGPGEVWQQVLGFWNGILNFLQGIF